MTDVDEVEQLARSLFVAHSGGLLDTGPDEPARRTALARLCFEIAESFAAVARDFRERDT